MSDAIERLLDTVSGVEPQVEVRLTAGELTEILGELASLRRKLDGIAETNNLWDGS